VLQSSQDGWFLIEFEVHAQLLYRARVASAVAV